MESISKRLRDAAADIEAQTDPDLETASLLESAADEVDHQERERKLLHDFIDEMGLRLNYGKYLDRLEKR